MLLETVAMAEQLESLDEINEMGNAAFRIATQGQAGVPQTHHQLLSS